MSIIENLSKEQIEDYKQAFSLFDHDDSGTITARELGLVLQALG